MSLFRASDLLSDTDTDLGFEDGRYRNFPLCPHPLDAPKEHERFKDRFYVTSLLGTVGLVPWPGSQIIWPHETAWTMDLTKAEVKSLLKDEPKKPKR